MTREFTPPYTPLARRDDALRERGFVLLDASDVRHWLDTDALGLERLHRHWNRLAPDRYLRDGGQYRRRRHGNYVVAAGSVQNVPHRAHWQPLDYNALHGGMLRWFEPLEATLDTDPLWRRILVSLAEAADRLRGAQPWYVEAHLFRIDTTGGIGRPTPEGAHRDGVDLVAVFMIERHAIKGGESRVFEAQGPAGQRFTLREPWSLLLLDDARMIHETTPIQPDPPGQLGWRDTLVITLRSGGFQQAEETQAQV